MTASKSGLDHEPRRARILAIVEALDAAVDDRILVFGSLPPEGRDLDLLVRPRERSRIEALFLRDGFVRRGDRWALFRDCESYGVELVPASRWRLPAKELAAVFAEATPLDGMTHIVRPAPHHVLLAVARRVAIGGSLSGKLRARIERALEEDPDAWARARATARRWGAVRAVAAVEAAYRHGRPISRVESVGMRVELLESAGGQLARMRVLARRLAAHRGRRGGVVALSGLDGAGKSSQARSIRDALAGLDVDAIVEWTPDYNLLYHLPKPVKRRLLQLLKRLRPPAVARATPDLEASRLEDRKTIFRQQSDPLAALLATITAVVNAVSQRRATSRHLRQGRVVICDRYTLDSAVHLRYRYGPERRFRFQISLIRALSPKPLCAYFLDVAPEVALARKVDQHQLEDLRKQAELYREDHRRLGVRRLDGTRPRVDLCAEIASEVWRQLR